MTIERLGFRVDAWQLIITLLCVVSGCIGISEDLGSSEFESNATPISTAPASSTACTPGSLYFDPTTHAMVLCRVTQASHPVMALQSFIAEKDCITCHAISVVAPDADQLTVSRVAALNATVTSGTRKTSRFGLSTTATRMTSAATIAAQLLSANEAYSQTHYDAVITNPFPARLQTRGFAVDDGLYMAWDWHTTYGYETLTGFEDPNEEVNYWKRFENCTICTHGETHHLQDGCETAITACPVFPPLVAGQPVSPYTYLTSLMVSGANASYERVILDPSAYVAAYLTAIEGFYADLGAGGDANIPPTSFQFRPCLACHHYWDEDWPANAGTQPGSSLPSTFTQRATYQPPATPAFGCSGFSPGPSATALQDCNNDGLPDYRQVEESLCYGIGNQSPPQGTFGGCNRISLDYWDSTEVFQFDFWGATPDGRDRPDLTFTGWDDTNHWCMKDMADICAQWVSVLGNKVAQLKNNQVSGYALMELLRDHLAQDGRVLFAVRKSANRYKWIHAIEDWTKYMTDSQTRIAWDAEAATAVDATTGLFPSLNNIVDEVNALEDAENALPAEGVQAVRDLCAQVSGAARATDTNCLIVDAYDTAQGNYEDAVTTAQNSLIAAMTPAFCPVPKTAPSVPRCGGYIGNAGAK